MSSDSAEALSSHAAHGAEAARNGDRAGSAASNQAPRRKQVKLACTNCRKAHAACDDIRPCSRCTKYNLVDSCEDKPRRKRTAGTPPSGKRSFDEFSAVSHGIGSKSDLLSPPASQRRRSASAADDMGHSVMPTLLSAATPGGILPDFEYDMAYASYMYLSQSGGAPFAMPPDMQRRSQGAPGSLFPPGTPLPQSPYSPLGPYAFLQPATPGAPSTPPTWELLPGTPSGANGNPQIDPMTASVPSPYSAAGYPSPYGVSQYPGYAAAAAANQAFMMQAAVAASSGMTPIDGNNGADLCGPITVPVASGAKTPTIAESQQHQQQHPAHVNTAVAMWRMSDRKIVEWNLAFRELFGYTEEAMKALTCIRLFPSRELSRGVLGLLASECSRAVVTRTSVHRQMAFQKATGQEFLAEIMCTPQYTPGGEFSGHCLMSVSERSALIPPAVLSPAAAIFDPSQISSTQSQQQPPNLLPRRNSLAGSSPSPSSSASSSSNQIFPPASTASPSSMLASSPSPLQQQQQQQQVLSPPGSRRNSISVGGPPGPAGPLGLPLSPHPPPSPGGVQSLSSSSSNGSTPPLPRRSSVDLAAQQLHAHQQQLQQQQQQQQQLQQHHQQQHQQFYAQHPAMMHPGFAAIGHPMAHQMMLGQAQAGMMLPTGNSNNNNNNHGGGATMPGIMVVPESGAPVPH